MNENERDPLKNGDVGNGEELSHVGEALPAETAEPQKKESVPPEPERISLRFREGSRRKYLLLGGVLVLLLAAILIVCTMVGGGGDAQGGEGTDTTDAGSTDGVGSETEELYLYGFDPSAVPEGHIAFRPTDLSVAGGSLENETDLTVDVAALLQSFRAANSADPTPILGDGPLVLILHTHTTEGYSPEGAISWDGTGEFGRSENSSENVTAIGKVLADALCEAGIPAIACDIVHDQDGSGAVTNVGAYARASETVRTMREAYPSIRYVIDLHRDTVFDEDGNAVRAVAPLNGAAAAQVGLSVSSGAYEKWESALAFALALAEDLNADGTRIARTTVLDDAEKLGAAAEDCLLLHMEIGTAANSRAEAKRSAEYLGDALAALIARVEASAAEG